MPFKVTDVIFTAPMHKEPLGGCDGGTSCDGCSHSISPCLMDLVDQHVLPQLRSVLKETVAKAEKAPRTAEEVDQRVLPQLRSSLQEAVKNAEQTPQTIEEIEMLETRLGKVLDELRAMKKAKAKP